MVFNQFLVKPIFFINPLFQKFSKSCLVLWRDVWCFGWRPGWTDRFPAVGRTRSGHSRLNFRRNSGKDTKFFAYKNLKKNVSDHWKTSKTLRSRFTFRGESRLMRWIGRRSGNSRPRPAFKSDLDLPAETFTPPSEKTHSSNIDSWSIQRF